MEIIHFISTKFLSISDIQEIITLNKKLKLSEESMAKISASNRFLQKKIETSERPIYGVNNGIGALSNVKLRANDLQKLQENLIKSHACGTGEKVPKEIVKLFLFLKIQSLSHGYSGVQLVTVNRLIDFYNNDVLPVIFTQGASVFGDTAALAHLALPLIGEGDVYLNHKIVAAKKTLRLFNWKKITLQPNEANALLNGTQFTSAYSTYQVINAYKLSYLADLIGSISLDGFLGSLAPFQELIQLVKPHNGQLKTATNIKQFLEDSQICTQEREHVQDPYSFRCMPQVHGATKDSLNFIKKTVETEINAVSENILLFAKENKILSGGNFNGQALALALDYLAIAMSELGDISERRMAHLLSGKRELPPFLVMKSGVNIGFKILQHTVANLVNQNKQLANPASIHSTISSNLQEDFVSSSGNAALKSKQVIANVERILAMELFYASQALYFREPLQTSPFLQSFITMFRQDVPLVKKDVIMHHEMEKSISFIKNLHIDNNELF